MSKHKTETTTEKEDAIKNKADVRSAEQRRTDGKALRNKVPRELHSGWTPPKNRKNPIDILIESNEGRVAELIPLRFERMLQSPFAFYRGTAAIMAADLAHTPISGIRVQACGDAHLMNFGGFATPERLIIFDINDLDETLPAPWEWDLKRLTTSIAVAARHLELSESEAAKAVKATACAYREQMLDYSSMRALDVWYDIITLDKFLARLPNDEVRAQVLKRVQKARTESSIDTLFPKLAEYDGIKPKIKDNPPLIFHPHKDLAPGLESEYAEVIAEYRASLPVHVRVLFDRFQFCDVAFRPSGSVVLGHIVSYRFLWLQTTILCSYKSKRPVHLY